ncbi:MAG: hypothetical protein OHK0023_18280 [Anaerolineae bacterium]
MYRYVCLGALILLLLWPSKALAQGELAIITSPQAGASLVGVVTVQGSAFSPNFVRYRLEYAFIAPNVELQWLPIVEIAQEVTNNTLALWDTSSISDGEYQLRLRVFLRDGSTLQTVVQNLRVVNRSATPLPTPLSPATEQPPTAFPTPGASPTSSIAQPPTSAPRATPQTALVSTPASSGSGRGSNISAQFAAVVSALQGAFCLGVYLALFLLGVMAAYRFVYIRVRRR